MVNITNTKSCPYISPLYYKPTKKCLRTNISPGLISGGLRYCFLNNAVMHGFFWTFTFIVTFLPIFYSVEDIWKYKWIRRKEQHRVDILFREKPFCFAIFCWRCWHCTAETLRTAIYLVWKSNKGLRHRTILSEPGGRSSRRPKFSQGN